MKKGIRVLYMTYDGISDPLGGSQVLPYLKGISKAGHSIYLISLEKPERFKANKESIENICQQSGITWEPILYKKGIMGTGFLWNHLKLMRAAIKAIAFKKPEIVHCRSYIPSLTGLFLKKKFGLRFVFDMRGFWADERLEGRIWKTSNPLQWVMYRWFKKKEREFFKQADAIISLTVKGKSVIEDRFKPTAQIRVIPCCADEDFFQIPSQEIGKKNLKNELGIKENAFVVVYTGSLGTWYLPNEMLDFFSHVKVHRPNAVFLCISGDKPGELFRNQTKFRINQEDIIVLSGGRDIVKKALGAADMALCFINPVPSKIASSPTKLGEYLMMGLPVFANSGIGDMDMQVTEGGGFVFSSFNTNTYSQVLNDYFQNPDKDPDVSRKAGMKYFSLEEGVRNYLSVYRDILSPGNSY